MIFKVLITYIFNLAVSLTSTIRFGIRGRDILAKVLFLITVAVLGWLYFRHRVIFITLSVIYLVYKAIESIKIVMEEEEAKRKRQKAMEDLQIDFLSGSEICRIAKEKRRERYGLQMDTNN